MSYTVWIPSINTVSFSANPISASASLIIYVTANEIEKILEPAMVYAGDTFAGEVW